MSVYVIVWLDQGKKSRLLIQQTHEMFAYTDKSWNSQGLKCGHLYSTTSMGPPSPVHGTEMPRLTPGSHSKHLNSVYSSMKQEFYAFRMTKPLSMGSFQTERVFWKRNSQYCSNLGFEISVTHRFFLCTATSIKYF